MVEGARFFLVGKWPHCGSSASVELEGGEIEHAVVACTDLLAFCFSHSRSGHLHLNNLRLRCMRC